MREDHTISKSPWRRVMAKMNTKSREEGVHSDHRPRHIMKSFSDDWQADSCKGGIGRRKFKPKQDSSPDLKIFVGTWNVGGNSPHDEIDLRDWLRPQTPADIYVLGFQEVVPLNVGNVLGPEDSGPTIQWLSLIRKALNGNSEKKLLTAVSDSRLYTKPRVNCFSDLLSSEDEQRIFPFSGSDSSSSSEEEYSPEYSSRLKQHKYLLVTSKQMVGIFICLWVKRELHGKISGLNVSCVGRGVMGCLGNKGAISISMLLREKRVCFVCSHLASGEKEGDLKRRNADVAEILKRTKFKKLYSIMDHDYVIWLGDLNYRLASNWGETKLLDERDWREVVEKDELSIERRRGVFRGWEEGEICFPPTYKYIANSDTYVVQTSSQKRRTPAWCDRILWRGNGLKQMYYARSESRFSDHRPVCSLFCFDVNVPN